MPLGVSPSGFFLSSASSNEKTLTIVKSEIAISADETEVAEEDDLWAEMAAMPVNLPAGYDHTFAIPIPVGNLGTESFCGCHIVSLTDTTTRKVVSVDSAAWIYKPRCDG